MEEQSSTSTIITASNNITRIYPKAKVVANKLQGLQTPLVDPNVDHLMIKEKKKLLQFQLFGMSSLWNSFFHHQDFHYQVKSPHLALWA